MKEANFGDVVLYPRLKPEKRTGNTIFIRGVVVSVLGPYCRVIVKNKDGYTIKTWEGKIADL